MFIQNATKYNKKSSMTSLKARQNTTSPFNVAFFRTFIAYAVPASEPLIFLTKKTCFTTWHNHLAVPVVGPTVCTKAPAK